MTSPAVLMHASCVAVAGRAVLIIGPSGSGKSSVALALMAAGAKLVSDDQTELYVEDTRLMARSPTSLAGLIEARGVGILSAEPAQPSEVVLVADLGQAEAARLPPRRSISLLDKPVDLVLGKGNAHFPWALMCYLKGSREA